MTYYEELKQKHVKNIEIIEAVARKNKENIPHSYSEEEINLAFKDDAGKEMNEIYNRNFFSVVNSFGYFVYWVLTFIALPLCFFKNIWGIVFAYFGMVVILIISIVLDKVIKRDKPIAQSEKWNNRLNRLSDFSNQTSLFMYSLTTVGFMLDVIEVGWFLFIYVAFLIGTVVTFYYTVLKKYHSKNN